MQEYFRVCWGVELEDEIYRWDVETAGCDIGCKEQGRICRGGEVGEIARADFLWLLPVERDEGDGLAGDGGEKRAQDVLVVIHGRARGYIEYCFLRRWIDGGKYREDSGQLLRSWDFEVGHHEASWCLLFFSAVQTANFHSDLDGIA